MATTVYLDDATAETARALALVTQRSVSAVVRDLVGKAAARPASSGECRLVIEPDQDGPGALRPGAQQARDAYSFAIWLKKRPGDSEDNPAHGALLMGLSLYEAIGGNVRHWQDFLDDGNELRVLLQDTHDLTVVLPEHTGELALSAKKSGALQKHERQYQSTVTNLKKLKEKTTSELLEARSTRSLLSYSAVLLFRESTVDVQLQPYLPGSSLCGAPTFISTIPIESDDFRGSTRGIYDIWRNAEVIDLG